MKTRRFYDKTSWMQNGTWLDEPDYAVWLDENTLYPCVLRRTIFGAWTGLVGVAPHHPLYKADLKEPTFQFIDVHGGVAYTGLSYEDDMEITPPIRRWWIGFDCMDEGDLCPAFNDDSVKSKVRRRGGKKSQSTQVYRNMEYATANVVSLASQLATIDPSVIYAEELF